MTPELRIFLLIVLLSIVFSGCQTVPEPTRAFDWLPGIGQQDTPGEHQDRSPGDQAHALFVEILALAGASIAVIGFILLAVPGMRQLGGATILSGAGAAALAIAFGHPWVPFLAFGFLATFMGWKIYKRIISKRK